MLRRKQSSEADPADWFYVADERLRGADLFWEKDGLTLVGIELLQESTERYLKGYLIAKGWPLARTHDLRTLVSEAAGIDPAFARFKGLAADLTVDFFAQHYPGGDWTNVGVNYETMRKEAGAMIDLIHQSLPQFFPPPPAN
jgi:HEPN domain-containing protein